MRVLAQVIELGASKGYQVLLLLTSETNEDECRLILLAGRGMQGIGMISG